MDIEDLFKEQPYQEEEKDFQLVLPELNPCSAENTDEISQKKKEKKECCKEKNLTCSSLQQEESKTCQIEEKKSQQKNLCYKCKVNQANYANKQDRVCKQCFLTYMVHRFKSSLRQNLKIWKDDLNLICISGGSSSMALLKLMHESLFGYTQKKMFFKVHVIYIDEGQVVYNWSKEQHEDNLKFIIETCENYQFSYSIIPIESIYDIGGENLDIKQIDEQEKALIEDQKAQDEVNHAAPVDLDSVLNKIIQISDIEIKRERLKRLIESLPTVSSFREDLLFYIKKWLISDFALNHNFKKILLGTNAHKLSTQLLAQLAKGRGISIPHEISFIDDKNFGGKIAFMNPMREYLQKEIALYNYLNKVNIIMQRSIAEIKNGKISAPAHGSTDQLISNFFSKLQDKFNVNTVPTVVRLTNKLLKTQAKGKYPFCPLCFGLRDNLNNLLEMGSTIKQIIPLEGGGNDVQSIQSSDEWLSSEIEKSFCFGCKRLSTSAINKKEFIENLPQVIKENSIKTLNENQ